MSMGHWNHRVIRYKADKSWCEGEVCYMIHEVHYTAGGVAYTWTERGTDVAGASLKELGEVLAMMKRCLKQPVLEVKGDKLFEVESGKRACLVKRKR